MQKKQYLCTEIMMRRYCYIIAALVISITTAIAKPHIICNIGATEGMSDLLVNSIYEDADGFMWFGTGSTLELFDGLTLTHYPLPQSEQGELRVEAIAGYKDEIYCCNNHSLYCLNKRTEQLLPILDGQIDGILRDLCVVSNSLYIATSRGLYIYHLDQHQLSRELLNGTSVDAPQNELRHMCADGNGTIWFTSKAGLHARSANGGWSHYYYSELPEGGFTELAIIEDDIILGSFHNGVYAFHTASAQFSLSFYMVSPIVSLQAYGDLLMIATDGDGVYFWDRDKNPVQHLTTASHSAALTSNSIYRARIDSRGILWMGFYQHGIDYTLGQTDQFCIHHTDMLNTEGLAVRALAIHNQQRLIGTREGLYLIDKSDRRKYYYDESVLNSKMVFSAIFHDGLYYIGTYGGGLYTMSPKGERPKRIISSAIGRDIFSLTTDSAGRVWVGSDIGAAVLQDRKVVRAFSSANSILPTGYVYCIYFDQSYRGWVCTENGLVRYDAQADSLTTAGLPASFPTHMNVRAIYNDKYNRLFFMPQKGETYVVDSDLQPCEVALPKETNLFMIEDTKQQLWIGTTDGLYCLKADNSLHRYGFANGLPSSIFTLCPPYRDEEGTVWLGNSRGLIYFKADSVDILAYKQPVQCQISNNQYPISNSISFRFSDLRYSDPGSAYYEYWLEGYEQTKHIVRSRGQATYTDLEYGNYRFHVRVHGEPDSETVVAVHVPLSKWAWTQIIIWIILLLSIYPVYRLIRHYRRTRKLADMPDEQLAEVVDPVDKPKYSNVAIPAETLDALHAKMDELMEEEQLYLRQDLKIAEIAQQLNVPPYQLSYLFTQHMQSTFYDYIYDFRIEEFKRRVVAGDIKRYTVEALAEQCGFNSRASFFRIFKKKVGMTPNEFIKSLK